MNRHSQLVAVLGVIALAVLISITSLLYNLYGDTFTQASATNTSSTSATNLAYDPLVTVVPEGARGGKPQPLSTDPQRGANDPSVVLVEFGDFECETCAAMNSIVDEVVEAYPTEVLHVWKDFPIPALHPNSESAAQAARCAQEQDAFWEYHDELFRVQQTFALQPWLNIAEQLELDMDQFKSCVENRVKSSLVLQGYFIARTFEIEETPAYFINDQLVTGAQTYEELTAIIEQKITEASASK